MKRLLTEAELQADLDELISEVGRVRRPRNLHVRDRVPEVVFPESGYATWQERWYMGTGREPDGWQLSHWVV